jgi:hypothetical protein
MIARALPDLHLPIIFCESDRRRELPFYRPISAEISSRIVWADGFGR